MTTRIIDLDDFLEPGRITLSGEPQGREVRLQSGLCDMDDAGDTIVIQAPDRLRAVSTSFLQGLIRESLQAHGVDEFRRRFHFRGEALESTAKRVLEYAANSGRPW